MSTINPEFLELVHLVFEIFLIPLCWILWKLNTSVNDLQVTIHRDFVRKDDHERTKEHVIELLAQAKAASQARR